MDETILRVIQALEIQTSFDYILTAEQIEDLKRRGYKITRAQSKDFSFLYHCIIERHTTMNLYLVCNGRYEDSRYYSIPALDGMDALEKFISYAKENDIEIDSPQYIKPISKEEITVLV